MQHFLCISIHPRLGEERQGPARPPPGRHALSNGPPGSGGVVQQHEPQANEVEAGAGAGPGTEESWKRGVGETCLVVGGCTRIWWNPWKWLFYKIENLGHPLNYVGRIRSNLSFEFILRAKKVKNTNILELINFFGAL